MSIILMELSKKDLVIALEESVKLQSHYAESLNLFDGGQRRPFKNSEEWVERLQEIGTIQSYDDNHIKKLHRIASYRVDEILCLVGQGDKIFNEKIVSMNSTRYQTFKKDDCKCILWINWYCFSFRKEYIRH